MAKWTGQGNGQGLVPLPLWKGLELMLVGALVAIATIIAIDGYHFARKTEACKAMANGNAKAECLTNLYYREG